MDVSHTVAVVGPGVDATAEDLRDAREVGRLLAEAGCVVVTGGLGGVMEEAAAGATGAGGIAVGILPGSDRAEANPHLTAAVATGLGELRNGLVVRAAEAVIGVGCSWGTLSEVALAMGTGIPVVTIRCWQLADARGRPVDLARRASATGAVGAVLGQLGLSGGPTSGT